MYIQCQRNMRGLKENKYIATVLFWHVHVYMYMYSVSPRINEKGGGDLADAQSMKLYLGAWCMYMYILHS